jgi:hypothetical protein
MNETHEPGDDELVQLTRGELQDVAADAAKAGAAAVNRHALFWAFLVGFAASSIAAIAIAVPVGLLIHHNTESQARSWAVYDCNLDQTFAGIFGRFIQSDAQLRVQQAHQSITPRLLHDIERVIPLPDLEAAAAASTRLSENAANMWTSRYLPPLTRLVNLDCRAALP